MPLENLDLMFRPRSIAIVGASPKRGTARNNLLRVVAKRGFPGPIYPIHLSEPTVEGLKAYPSVEDLPEAPDLALIITPAETVPEVVAQCGRRGVKAAIVYSAGFEETDGGKEHARRLAAAAAEHGVLVLGPNCQGIWSVKEDTILSYGPAAFALEELKLSPIAVVSQSGALAGAIGGYLQRSGIGCSYLAMVGNETCLDMLDVLSWIVEQDDVRVVGLYLEGLTDGARLHGIAARARARGVQIVALKAGRSAMGQEATASHTGKIAASHAVYADAFEQLGIISVDTIEELLSALEVLAFLPDPRAGVGAAAGVSILSSSGGAGALLADQSEQFAVPMADFRPDTVQALDGLLPDFARKQNPVDLTGAIRSIPNLLRDTCAVIGADPGTEAIIVQFSSSGLRDLEEDGDAFVDMVRRSGFPMVVSFVAERLAPAMRTRFREAGILLVDDTSAAMRALSLLYRRRAYHAQPEPEPQRSQPGEAAPEGWAEMMDYCDQSGLTPAPWRLLKAGERAEAACAGLNFPVVVKVLPSESEHKTELGLVRLGVATPAQVDGHSADFRAQLGKPQMDVLVQEMIGGGVEVVLACMHNADLGPIMAVGSGGVAIELYRDVRHLMLPVTPAQVTSALKRLKLWTLLNGFRGKPAVDVDAFVSAAVRFGNKFLATRDIREFEINPVIVRPHGLPCATVDALVVAGEAAAMDRHTA